MKKDHFSEYLHISQIIRSVVGEGSVGLHEPNIGSSELDEVISCLQSGYVSSIGKAILDFESKLCSITGVEHAIAVVNGTSAIHLSLVAAGVIPNDEVLVPALTFIGSVNPIILSGAIPHFCDSSLDHFGVDVKKLSDYLQDVTEIRGGFCWNKKTNRRISAIVPVHIFGHIGEIEELCELASQYNLTVIEDAAEALGSTKNGVHAGGFGLCGVISFNGNKIVTTGGGGAILTNDDVLAKKLRHIGTTAKINHPYEYRHDELGFNYRMPAINAALGIAQLNRLPAFLESKKNLLNLYEKAFASSSLCKLYLPPRKSISNNWLNTIILGDSILPLRDRILDGLNQEGIACRPVWGILSEQAHLINCPKMKLENSLYLSNRLINIPSSPVIADKLKTKNFRSN